MNDDPDQQHDIERAAAEWVVRLAGAHTTPGERRAFEAWLGESEDHYAAFERAQRTWSDLGGLKDDPGALRSVVEPQRPNPTPKIKAAIAFVLLGVGALAAGYQLGDPWIALVADHRTGFGDARTVLLADGSLVYLDSSSAIAVRYDASVRRVKLLAGAIYVEATSRESAGDRPFVLEAAEGSTTALGTKFVIERIGKEASVVAIEHKVEVALDGGGDGAVTLSPGQSVRYGAEGGVGPVSTTDLRLAAPWRAGQLIFKDAPLAEVVESLNRHRRERIVIVGGALAARRVSGVFATDDLSDAVDIIAAELKARAVSAPGLVTILY